MTTFSTGDRVRCGNFRGTVVLQIADRVKIDSGKRTSWFCESKVRSLEEISRENQKYIQDQQDKTEPPILKGTTTIKALTLKQPYAALIASGLKQVETRSWKTNYRGAIAIHAGAQPKKRDEIVEEELNCQRLGIDNPVHSSIVALAELTDCIEMTEKFISQQTEQELSCGYWKPGNFAWILKNVRPVQPYPKGGYVKLWDFSYFEGDLVFLEKEEPVAEVPPEAKPDCPRERSNQSGSLYRYTKVRELKTGEKREYPVMGGIPRNSNTPEDWYWGYSYVTKGDDGRWRDRTASVSRKKLPEVSRAIKEGKSYTHILAIIKS